MNFMNYGTPCYAVAGIVLKVALQTMYILLS